MRHMTLALLLICAACSSSTGVADPTLSGSSTTDSFDRNAMLANFANTIVLAGYQDLSATAEALEDAIELYRDALAANDPNAAARLADARAAFDLAMDACQAAELFQVGPAGSSASAIAGQDRRNKIYSWPTTNACRVDQELVEGRFLTAADYVSGELVNVTGLDALRQLLFDNDTTNSCPAGTDINLNGSWDALVQSGGLPLRRAEYALILARDIAIEARALFQQWSPSGQNFTNQLATAGQGSSVYNSAQQAVNEVYFALFYLELITKDLKVALPLGINSPSGPQPESGESAFARRDVRNVLVNLRTAQRFFLGNRPNETAAVGFDDMLSSLGAATLSQQVLQETATAIQAFEALPVSIADAIANQPAQTTAAFESLKRVTDILKGQFASVLNLRVPAQGAGDND
jgi:predicted lipoprotein